METYQPLAVVKRNNIPESYHYGAIVVADATGKIHYAAGNPDMVYYPRSSLKLIQALLFHESGAYQEMKLTPKYLALACASHDGEGIHTGSVKSWLKQLDLLPDDLACGSAYPNNYKTRISYYKEGKLPDRSDHECSGKHCGFLSVCRHMGYDVKSYHKRENPTQKMLQSKLMELSGLSADNFLWGVDGCRLPTPAFGLKTMATLNAKFAGSTTINNKTAAAMDEIVNAVITFPEYVSGSENTDKKIISALNGKIVLKIGAEGSYTAVLPEKKLGIVIKISDGSKRALPVVLIGLLKKLGAINSSEYDTLKDEAEPAIVNSLKEPVGKIVPCF